MIKGVVTMNKNHNWCLVEDPENIKIKNICLYCNYWQNHYDWYDDCPEDKISCYLDCMNEYEVERLK